MVALAATCCFVVAGRSSGYSRQVWLLLATAFSLETLAQGYSAYFQSFVPGSSLSPMPSDVPYFLWAAPVFMIFLPRSSEDAPGFDWLRAFDFLQVAIVAVTIYIYFLYAPSRWQADRHMMLREILLLYIGRDSLLSAGFLIRSRTSRTTWLRPFFLVLGIVFVSAVLSDSAYLWTLNAAVSAATWADLLWMLPHLIIVFFALSWEPSASAATAYRGSRIGGFLSRQFLPIGLPLLVIFMGQAIARERFALGWSAVILSVVCSSTRLILTNRKTRLVAEHLLNTEKALRSSEQMLSTAFRSSPDAFSINIFPNGPYLDVNEGFTRLTGFSREETLGKTPGQMKLWVEMNERTKLLERLSESGEVREVEFRFLTKSGNMRFGQMSVCLTEFDGHRCALVVVRDITARKEAENILRSSEERFRGLVENLHVGIVTFGPDGNMVFANQAAVQLLKFSLPEIIGKKASDLGLEPLFEDGSVVPMHLRPVQTVIATREPVSNALIGWRRAGSSEEVWTLIDAVPEFSSTGEILRVVVSFTNITEQRRAARALRESEERFRTLVADLHVGVMLHSPKGYIEFANEAACGLLGIGYGSAVGKHAADLGVILSREDGAALGREEDPVRSVFQTGKAVTNRLIAIRRAGGEGLLWLFGNAVPQFDGNGQLIRVITTFADVTQMKNAERAIHQLSTQLLRIQDEERRRLGRELHDGLAQTVLAINLNLAQARQSLSTEEHRAAQVLEKARSLTQQMSREIRTLSYLLHPPLLDELGLVSALREYAHGFGERSAIETGLEAPSDFRRLPQPLELALFRIVQESLANIQRHSESPSATIRLRQEDGLITLEITDVGRGMRVPQNGASDAGLPRLGVGITGMHERISQLGGHLDITSGPAGTTVRATISLRDLKTHDEVPQMANSVQPLVSGKV